MNSHKYKQIVSEIFSHADIQINGTRAWDIQVKNENFYKQVLGGGSLAFGESYMNGCWDVASMDQMMTKIFNSDVQKHAYSWKYIFPALLARFFNRQTSRRAFEVGEKHYNLGNDLYEQMLDSRMVYTCGYWKNASTLEEAQEAKLDLVCKKIGLQAGQRVLDIGCGWGSFAKFAAEKYGAQVVGITISKEQIILAQKRCAGLPIKIRLQDYREINEQFDHIVSLGMFEHVGYKNYREYMKVVARCLKDDGLFLLHTIGGNLSVRYTDPWIEKYIFANSMLPSIAQIAKACEGIFVMEDWHSFGDYYDKTLMAWFSNFEKNWDTIKENYSERFFRMWTFYLLSCAGTFRARKNQLWQIVLSKNGVPGGYTSLR